MKKKFDLYMWIDGITTNEKLIGSAASLALMFGAATAAGLILEEIGVIDDTLRMSLENAVNSMTTYGKIGLAMGGTITFLSGALLLENAFDYAYEKTLGAAHALKERYGIPMPLLPPTYKQRQEIVAEYYDAFLKSLTPFMELKAEGCSEEVKKAAEKVKSSAVELYGNLSQALRH